jgi:hypothetical protein
MDLDWSRLRELIQTEGKSSDIFEPRKEGCPKAQSDERGAFTLQPVEQWRFLLVTALGSVTVGCQV